MNFGVWSVNGKAWVRGPLGGILRYDTIDAAMAVAVDQQRVFPETEWAVLCIGPDDQPYLDPGPVTVKPKV